MSLLAFLDGGIHMDEFLQDPAVMEAGDARIRGSPRRVWYYMGQEYVYDPESDHYLPRDKY